MGKKNQLVKKNPPRRRKSDPATDELFLRIGARLIDHYVPSVRAEELLDKAGANYPKPAPEPKPRTLKKNPETGVYE